MEYETKRDLKTGRIKPEERLTPARRYSYLDGADEECHTAQALLRRQRSLIRRDSRAKGPLHTSPGQHHGSWHHHEY